MDMESPQYNPNLGNAISAGLAGAILQSGQSASDLLDKQRQNEKKYRVRRGFRGKCVLQVLRDTPSLIGGRVDSSVRDLYWEDVDWNNAPTIVKCFR